MENRPCVKSIRKTPYFAMAFDWRAATSLGDISN
jgi:hypothetical protein